MLFLRKLEYTDSITFFSVHGKYTEKSVQSDFFLLPLNTREYFTFQGEFLWEENIV